jgi:hypothetical protein
VPAGTYVTNIAGTTITVNNALTAAGADSISFFGIYGLTAGVNTQMIVDGFTSWCNTAPANSVLSLLTGNTTNMTWSKLVSQTGNVLSTGIVPASTPASSTVATVVPGTAATTVSAISDSVCNATVTTSITGTWSLKIGPTSGTITQTVAGGATPGPVAGSVVTFNLPAGWYYQWAWTVGAVSVASQNTA